MWPSPWRKIFRRGCSATAATASCSMSAGWDACSANRRRLATSSHRRLRSFDGTRIADLSHGTRITRITDPSHGTQIARISRSFWGTPISSDHRSRCEIRVLKKIYRDPRNPRPVRQRSAESASRVAIRWLPTQIGAMLLSSAHPGLTVVTGDMAAALAPVRLEVLQQVVCRDPRRHAP